MSGSIVNQIINYSNNQTNQYFVHTTNTDPFTPRKNITTGETQVQTMPEEENKEEIHKEALN